MSLPPGFELHQGFVGPQEGDRLLGTLWEQLDWQRHDIVLFGRRVPQPRLVAWCSDPGVRYRYSGLTLQPAAWHSDLDDLRERASVACGARFNSVLANAYRDGRDSMGWHADDEPELGARPTIASLTLGAVRRLLIRPRGGGHSTPIDLPHGSLLIMRGASQEAWQHSLPRTRSPIGLRINLTFRQVIGPGVMS